MSAPVTKVEVVPTGQASGENGRGAERTRTVQQHAARLQAAFIHALTEDDLRAIAAKLIEQARDGDKTSARLVLKYGFGRLMTQTESDYHPATETARAPKAAAMTAPVAAAPTAEQVMAAIHLKMQEQQALKADILGMRDAGGPPRPGAAPGKAPPAGGARR